MLQFQHAKTSSTIRNIESKVSDFALDTQKLKNSVLDAKDEFDLAYDVEFDFILEFKSYHRLTRSNLSNQKLRDLRTKIEIKFKLNYQTPRTKRKQLNNKTKAEIIMIGS